MKLSIFSILGLVLISSGGNMANAVVSSSITLSSGISFTNIDKSARPQDDFYNYMNGKWLKTANIPNDKSSWGTFQQLSESNIKELHQIIINLRKAKNLADNSNEQKIVYLYNSYMNESKLNKLALKPLLPLFSKVDNINSKAEIPTVIASLDIIGVSTPYSLSIHQDAKNSKVVVADLVQSGLSLPDRDYYIESQDNNLQQIKNKYETYISEMLTHSGDKNGVIDAKQIVQLETKLAKAQWSNVENRDPIKTYNNVPIKDLKQLMPDYNWDSYLSTSKLKNRIKYLIVSQPSYLKSLNEIINDTPLSTWKIYFKWHILNAYARDLSQYYHDKNFDFYGTVVSGIPKDTPRWKQALGLVNSNLGFALGKLYVQDYFPESSKVKMKKLVANLIEEYDISIESLDWMSKKTKKEAKKKLANMMLKIGYPDHWRDYSKLIIKKDDLIGNLIRSSEFEYNRNVNKLGKPIDRSEWAMTPQTVNAYYNPEFNEIVFPAAILQPPFFNPNIDDAANYGGIGAVIGHEISHAFDDQGSQYDDQGNLRNWWTSSDRKNFKAKTAQLVKQYNSYSPIKGYHVNGELTLGENIADNSGLSIAYKAYYLSLGGKKAPIIDGMTGYERLYANWAQVWCMKIRDKQALVYLKTDPHSPPKFRANGALSNQDSFYKAYNIKPGDKMYIKPQDRVSIW